MIVIKVDDREVRTFLNTLPKQVQERLDKGIQRWGKNAEKNFKMASAEAGFWSGEIYQSIHWRKRKLGGHMEISQEGIWSDSARPHWVALKRGRKITEWANDKGFAFGSNSILSNFPTKSIYVHPHPFIERTSNEEIQKLDQFISRELDRIK